MQIFFLCVILGLFHGLLFLPVALILLGKDNVDDSDDEDGERIFFWEGRENYRQVLFNPVSDSKLQIRIKSRG